MYYLYILLGLIALLCGLHVLINYNKRARMIKKIPGPKDDFLFGNALQIIRSAVDILIAFREYAAKWNGIYRLWMYPYGAVIIYNPEDIEVILSQMKYGDKSVIYTILKPWLHDGLLVSNGAKWQERRKILTPAFHFNILKQFSEIIEENSVGLVDNLKQTTGKPIDIVPVLSDFTLNSICETSMGTKLNDSETVAAKSYKKAIYELGNSFIQRFLRIYLYPDIFFRCSPTGRAQNKNLKIVHNFTSHVIEQRSQHNGQYDNNIFAKHEIDDLYAHNKKRKCAMLDLLIFAEKEGLIDREGVQEEGHDTTASGLTFFFMLLANHKLVQDKIFEELMEIYPDTSKPIKIEDLPKMKYLDCCIKESLRLYPPVHFISRKLNEPTVLSNYELPAGTICHISIFDLHHRADLFKNPKEFDPERFLPGNSLDRHPYAYVPFSAGPRNCIGQKFAMMEMKIAVAKVLREFELLPVTKPSDICLKADLVLRNNGPVLVNFIKRL